MLRDNAVTDSRFEPPLVVKTIGRSGGGLENLQHVRSGANVPTDGGNRSLPVLLIADLFHPGDNLTVELFLNGDVGHGRGRRSPMPVLLARREPDHIAG